MTGLLADLGWDPAEIVDLGGIDTARGPEMYLPLFLALRRVAGGPLFNIAFVR